MNPFYIKVMAAVCGLLGTLVLLFGNRANQKALSLVARVHEKNLDQEASESPVQVRFTGSPKHLKRAEGISSKLRVAGVVLVVLAAALTVYALQVERSTTRIADGPADRTQPLQPGTNATPLPAGSGR